MIEEAGAHFYKQSKILFRRWGELANILVYPLIGLFSLGLFAFFISTAGAPPETILFLLTGVIVWDIYSVSERAIAYGITLDIWSSCLKHTFTGGSSFSGFILGNSMFGLASAGAVLLLTGLVGIVIFGFNIFLAGPFLLNIFFVFVFANAFGLLINALMITKGAKYMSLVWVTPGIILIFSGIYYPVEILPEPLFVISQAIPTTHSLASLRASLGFNPENAVTEMAIGAVLSVAYFIASLFIFRWSIYKSKVSGLITKY